MSIGVSVRTTKFTTRNPQLHILPNEKIDFLNKIVEMVRLVQI
jgi:hypothetical protein